MTHVLDGGSLLQRIPWKKGHTFEDIASMYMKHVTKNFLNPVVVFDDYESGPTTKDMTHNRRSKGVFGQNVMFTPTMPLRSKKENFLSNSDNKQNSLTYCVKHSRQMELTVSMRQHEHIVSFTAIFSNICTAHAQKRLFMNFRCKFRHRRSIRRPRFPIRVQNFGDLATFSVHFCILYAEGPPYFYFRFV